MDTKRNEYWIKEAEEEFVPNKMFNKKEQEEILCSYHILQKVRGKIKIYKNP